MTGILPTKCFGSDQDLNHSPLDSQNCLWLVTYTVIVIDRDLNPRLIDFHFLPLTAPCVSAPCQNGGICNSPDDGSTYTCQCQDGFQGYNCQFPSKCSYSK